MSEQTESLDIIPAGAALVRAEIDVAIATAKAYPRHETKAIERAEKMACYNAEVAGACQFAIERKGRDGAKAITGPSVRLAEILVTCWGNVNVAARIIDINQTHVVAQGVAHDLETNVRTSSEVARRITDRNGRRYGDDMITVTAQAALSIAWRNAAIRIIPRVYVEHVLAKAIEYAVGGAKALDANRRKLIDRLLKAYPDLTEGRICAAVRRKAVAELTQADLEELLALGTAVHEGVHTLDEVFPPPAGAKPQNGRPASEPADGDFDLDSIEQEAR